MTQKSHDLLKKYDQPVPRYTSYPTAPHFKNEITQEDYRALIASIPADQSISLYMHIPFCRHLCTYCGCNTKILDHDAPVHEYIQTLKAEIALAGEVLGRKQKVSHIHFGGGTPNFAASDDLKDLMEHLRNVFALDAHVVTAMEMDPRLLTEQKVQELAAVGVNRVSMGIQDFQPAVQEAINRIQPFEMVKECTAWLRKAGIRSINYDMIYGLPLQTVESMKQNMRQLAELAPERVALFGYAHVPWFKEHQKKLEVYALPDVFARFEMAEAARQALIEAGYTAIGIDHFAKPQDELARSYRNKKLNRNFQGYTSDAEDILLSFGQTSISGFGHAYAQNTDKNREYREKVLSGQFPVVKACLLTPEDEYRRAVINSLMCYGTVDLLEIFGGHMWSDDVWTSALPRLRVLEQDGMVVVGDMALTITESGRPFTRVVASMFDAYLRPVTETGERKHAQAV